MVPQAAPEQLLPLTLHVTPVFGVPVTVALNCFWVPATICAVFGEMLTTTGGTTVTVAVSDLLESATDVAVTKTWAGLGIAPGAVYSPPVVMVPQDEPEQPAPLRAHVTL